jgi:hypothetical protein
VSPNPVKHVIAGERKDPISGYVTMTVHCKPANGKKECRIEAHNAHYIPTFHTNLISYDKATILEQGIYILGYIARKAFLPKTTNKNVRFSSVMSWTMAFRI